MTKQIIKKMNKLNNDNRADYEIVRTSKNTIYVQTSSLYTDVRETKTFYHVDENLTDNEIANIFDKYLNSNFENILNDNNIYKYREYVIK